METIAQTMKSKRSDIIHRPYVVVNVAMSADGKISTRERRQVAISGKQDFFRVDNLKAGSDAVMVGIGTILADDPSLTVKSEKLQEQRQKDGKELHPVRIIVDSMARTPPGAKILHKGPGKRIIGCSKRAPPECTALLSPYAEIIITGEEEVDLTSFLTILSEKGIRSLMVEGGGTLIWSLFEKGLIDEFSTFIGNKIIGGQQAPTPADGEGFIKEIDFPVLSVISVDRIEEGVLIRWKV